LVRAELGELEFLVRAELSELEILVRVELGELLLGLNVLELAGASSTSFPL
jgi:hypothetical protein